MRIYPSALFGAVVLIFPVASVTAQQLSPGLDEVIVTSSRIPTPLRRVGQAQVDLNLLLANLRKLLSTYLDPNQPYLSRRMLSQDSESGDYDQLARFGEWEDGDKPAPEDLS